MTTEFLDLIPAVPYEDIRSGHDFLVHRDSDGGRQRGVPLAQSLMTTASRCSAVSNTMTMEWNRPRTS